jgi:hypothetical protein
VERNGSIWTADFTFPGDAAAWGFTHSGLIRDENKPWRPRSWTIETPGVRLERRGWYDLLVGENGKVPRKVRIRFTPFGGDLPSDYDPALIFTNGAVALYTGQFDAFPLPSAAAAEKLPIDAGEIKLPVPVTRVTFKDRNGRIFHGGKRHPFITATGGTAYVLFGEAKTGESKEISTLIDPQLPAWLGVRLGEMTPRLLGYYASRLGPRSGGKPMLMVSWAGPTKGRRSMGGSVLPGLVLMTFEGDAVLKEDPVVRDAARWFIAHEAAHFWAGEIVGYQSASQSWITEGGADLLAIRGVSAVDSDYNAAAKLNELADECVKLAAGKPLRTAAERNEQRAFYACGAMIGLVAEGAARRSSGGDFFTFWRGLIDANRADGVVSQDDWLKALTRLARAIGSRAASAASPMKACRIRLRPSPPCSRRRASRTASMLQEGCASNDLLRADHHCRTRGYRRARAT